MTILNGWKEIADYLGRALRTVQRWEAFGLPVHRPKGVNRSAVFAITEELDNWAKNAPLDFELKKRTDEMNDIELAADDFVPDWVERSEDLRIESKFFIAGAILWNTTQDIDAVRKLRMKVQDVGSDFLNAELDLAMTFAAIAQAAREPSRRMGNEGQALRACKSVVRFLDRLHLPEPEDRKLRGRLDAVERVFIQSQQDRTVETAEKEIA